MIDKAMREQMIFKPKYSPLLWVLMLVYSAPFLFSIPNAAIGASGLDWKLFWLSSGTVWLLAGLIQMKAALLKRIVFEKQIIIEMYLQEETVQTYREPVHIFGDVAAFRGQRVHLRYLANAAELMQIFVSFAGMGKMDLVYEEGSWKAGGWSTEKNLGCLIVFAVYMMAMLYLRVDPLELIGPATDAFLLGWAAMLPVLGAVKLVQVLRDRSRWEKEEKEKWMQ
jgi:uncharacterized membrane protein